MLFKGVIKSLTDNTMTKKKGLKVHMDPKRRFIELFHILPSVKC